MYALRHREQCPKSNGPKMNIPKAKQWQEAELLSSLLLFAPSILCHSEKPQKLPEATLEDL